MKNKYPAFQFYPKDFLSDLNVASMSMQERGIYITLLCYCWIEKGLPADEEALKALCNSPKNWNKSWSRIRRCFKKKRNKLNHKRLEVEMQKLIEWSKKSAIGGKKSAEIRRRVVKPKLKGGLTKRQPRGNTPIPFPFPITFTYKNKENIQKKKEISQRDLIIAFETWWQRYPNKEDKGKALEKYLLNIKKYNLNPEVLEDALTGYIRCLKSKDTTIEYIKMAKTFLWQGSITKDKKIEPTWLQYLKYSEDKYKIQPRL